jgi:hypothetical protein
MEAILMLLHNIRIIPNYDIELGIKFEYRQREKISKEKAPGLMPKKIKLGLL